MEKLGLWKLVGTEAERAVGPKEGRSLSKEGHHRKEGAELSVAGWSWVTRGHTALSVWLPKGEAGGRRDPERLSPRRGTCHSEAEEEQVKS